MDANVEYHPGGSQRLLVKRGETVSRAVEISEFHHEPLGVERPALGVAAHQRPDTPPPVELRWPLFQRHGPARKCSRA